MIRFRELKVGDQFDFISPNRIVNSYFERCVKISPRCYTAVGAVVVMRVGTVDVDVHHVERAP